MLSELSENITKNDSLEHDFLLFLLKKFEGFSAVPYKCQAGVWTIGYGHTKGVTKKALPVSKEQASNMLSKDIVELTEIVCGSLSKSTLSPIQKCVVVSLVYNIGVGNWDNSTIKKKIESHDTVDSISEEFPRWNKVRVKGELVVSKGLVNRRDIEKDVFLNGTISGAYQEYKAEQKENQ